MAEKPRDAVVKFDTYRNVQLAVSRGLGSSLRQHDFLMILTLTLRALRDKSGQTVREWVAGSICVKFQQSLVTSFGLRSNFKSVMISVHTAHALHHLASTIYKLTGCAVGL